MTDTPGPNEGQTGNPASTATTSWFQSAVNAITGLYTLDAEAVAQVLALWTAARAAVSTVASGVAAAAANKTILEANAKYQDVPLTPAVLADMVVRDILPDSTGTTGTPPPSWPAARMSGVMGNTATQEAALSGISGNRFAALCYATGESYGIIDALRLWNRGQHLFASNPGPNYTTGTPLYVQGGSQAGLYGIDETELDRVVAYSRVRDEFMPDLEKLSKNTLSGADAVEIAVKQIMSTTDAQDLYAAAGGMPEQFHLLVDAAGDSAGAEHSMELAAHGAITYGQLEQIIAMSRINPRFYYLYGISPGGQTVANLYQAPMNLKWLPPFEIREAATAGAITTDQALEWMLEQGYPEDQAKAFSGAISTTATASVKRETEAMVLAELEAGMITQATATTALTNLGYTAESLPFIFDYVQAKAINSSRTSAISRVRTGFLASVTTNAQATAALSQVGVPSTTISALLADWTAEKSVPHTALTVAEIGWFVEHGTIPVSEGETLWKLRGYTDADVALLVQRYPAPANG